MNSLYLVAGEQLQAHAIKIICTAKDKKKCLRLHTLFKQWTELYFDNIINLSTGNLRSTNCRKSLDEHFN